MMNWRPRKMPTIWSYWRTIGWKITLTRGAPDNFTFVIVRVKAPASPLSG